MLLYIFRLAEEVKVVMCSVPTENITPCSLSISTDESGTVFTNETGLEANFTVYFSNYVQGNYTFRAGSVRKFYVL